MCPLRENFRKERATDVASSIRAIAYRGESLAINLAAHSTSCHADSVQVILRAKPTFGSRLPPRQALYLPPVRVDRVRCVLERKWNAGRLPNWHRPGANLETVESLLSAVGISEPNKQYTCETARAPIQCPFTSTNDCTVFECPRNAIHHREP